MKTERLTTKYAMAVGMVLALTVTACAGDSAPPAAEPTTGEPGSPGETAADSDAESALPDEIIFGFIASQSGPISGVGEEIARGAELAETIVNESGILGDTQLTVMIEDDGSEAVTAATATERLYDRGARFFAGGAASSISEPMLNTLARYGDEILLAGCGCTTELVQEEFGPEPWAFLTYPLGYHYQEAGIGFLQDLDPQPERIAIMHESGSFGTEQAELAVENLEGTGIEVVAVESYDLTTTDLSPSLTSIAQQDPDILYVMGRLDDGILATRQAHSLGLEVDLIVGSANVGTLEFAEALGPDAENVAFLGMWEPIMEFEASDRWPELLPSTQDWVADYRDAFDRDPTFTSLPIGYIPVVMTAIAIAETGSADPQDVADFLRSEFSTSTPMGHLEFSQSGSVAQHGFSQMRVFQWQDGEKAFIWPPDEANESVVYPDETW